MSLFDTKNDLFNKLLIKSSFKGPIIIKRLRVCGRIYSSAHTLKYLIYKEVSVYIRNIATYLKGDGDSFYQIIKIIDHVK